MKRKTIITIIVFIFVLMGIHHIYTWSSAREWNWGLTSANDNVIVFTMEQIHVCDSDHPADVFRSILDQDIELFVFETRYDNDFDNISGWWSKSTDNQNFKIYYWNGLQHILPDQVYYVEVEKDCILTIKGEKKILNDIRL